MPRHCSECDVDLPDGVNIQGLRQVNYCPFCGEGVRE